MADDEEEDPVVSEVWFNIIQHFLKFCATWEWAMK
jgi:hypothetical protein